MSGGYICIQVIFKQKMKEKWFKKMADELTKISWRSDMRGILGRVLGEKKRERVGKRFEGMRLLKEGFSKSEVARRLGVTRLTVRRWARKMKG